MAVPLHRPAPVYVDPDLVSEIHRLGERLAALQRRVTELEAGKRSAETSAATALQDLREILGGLTQEMVEDGMNHPSESLVRDYLETNSHGVSWIEIFDRVQARPSAVADFLRLAGRTRVGDAAMREELLRAGLRSNSIEIRDAAVQAAALWADPSAIAVLAEHRETIPWLVEYIETVKREIGLGGHASP